MWWVWFIILTAFSETVAYIKPLVILYLFSIIFILSMQVDKWVLKLSIQVPTTQVLNLSLSTELINHYIWVLYQQKCQKFRDVVQSARTLYSIGPCNLSTKDKLQVQYSNPNNSFRHHLCSCQLTERSKTVPWVSLLKINQKYEYISINYI